MPMLSSEALAAAVYFDGCPEPLEARTSLRLHGRLACGLSMLEALGVSVGSAAIVIKGTATHVRLLRKTEAAAYVGLTVSKFLAVCPVGPVDLNGELRWDVRKIDAWVDSLSAREVDDVEAIIARLG